MDSVQEVLDGMSLSDMELGEVKSRIGGAMGKAAAALTTILDRQSDIQVASVSQGTFGALPCPEVGESLAFRLGSLAGPGRGALALIARRDMQRMLGVLMGGDPDAMDGMPFDEMNMSAAGEIVSQVMEAAAADLSAQAGEKLELSVLQGVSVEREADLAPLLEAGAPLLLVQCRQTVRDVADGGFALFLPGALGELLTAQSRAAAAGGEVPAPVPTPETAAPEAPLPDPTPIGKEPRPGMDVRRPQFPDFRDQGGAVQALSSLNASLLMGVPLDVSIVIGKTKRKIRDVLEFGPGTVIALDKQTGAPAEIIVNGQLLAYGDVIVIGDNYGVRVTEIVGTKELLDSLGPGM